MFRRLILVAACCSSMLAIPAFAQDEPEPLAFIQHYRAAVEAFRNDDAPAMVQAARQVLAQTPDHATARYLLAVGRARQGWLGDAAEALGVLAQQGLTTRLEAVPAFAPLLNEARYAELRQALIHNRQVVGTSQLVHELELERFVPEGLLRLGNGDLLLGSVHQARIVRVTGEGDEVRISDWAAAADGQASDNQLCSALGMRASADGSQVYVATACMLQTAGAAQERVGRSGIFVYTTDGHLLASHWLPADDAEHVLGDVLPWDAETLITSDSLSGAILRLNLANGQFEAIVAPGVLPNPQGLVRSANGNGLYVADYQAGIFYLALNAESSSSQLQRLRNPGMTAMHGIDGLVRCNKTLVGIQNGVRPNRILAMNLDEDGLGIVTSEVLARGLAQWDEPTLGIVDQGHLLYVANSHWPRFNAEGELADEALDGPRLMATAIPGCDGSAR